MPVMAVPSPHAPLTRRRPRLAPWLAVRLLAAGAIVAAPFAVLLRVGTWLYLGRGWPTWAAVGAGLTAAIVVVTVIGALAARALTGRLHVSSVIRWIAVPLVTVYAMYGLLHLSMANAKTERVREYYMTIHPLLRLSLATWTLVDDDLVVTDGRREPDDYASMGLPPYPTSRHIVQDDGYVHAVDLRTIGRPWWRNWLTERYFSLLGFRTLRHVGTADHLHVSLPMESP
jgi:hypothetical protein